MTNFNIAALVQLINRYSRNTKTVAVGLKDFLSHTAQDVTIAWEKDDGTDEAWTVPNFKKWSQNITTGELTVSDNTGSSKILPSGIDAHRNVRLFDKAFKNGYVSGDQDGYWIVVARVKFNGQNQFARIDFSTSDHFGNGEEPTIGSIGLRSGNDDSVKEYVTPTVYQTNNAIKDIHIYPLGDDNSHVDVYVKLSAYSSFYTNALYASENATIGPLYDANPQSGVSNYTHYEDAIKTQKNPRVGVIVDQAHFAGYTSTDQNDYWIYIADVRFSGPSQHAKLDFVASRHYSNGVEPAAGFIALQTNNDPSNDGYVVPTVMQTRQSIKDIHIYPLGGDNSHVRVFVQLWDFTEFTITSVAQRDGVSVALRTSSPQETVGGDNRYPDNIHTLA